MDNLLLFVSLGLGLFLVVAAGNDRVARQVDAADQVVSGANVTHTTEYDESTKTLRFRMEVDYGSQTWDSGVRSMSTPDGGVAALAWTANSRGVRIEILQSLEAWLGAQPWELGRYILPTYSDEAFLISWHVKEDGFNLEFIQTPYKNISFSYGGLSVTYGKQNWEAGERTFPSLDGNLVTLKWSGSPGGVRVVLEQQQQAAGELATTPAA